MADTSLLDGPDDRCGGAFVIAAAPRVAFIILLLLACGALHAQADRCKQGYVWREAFSGDHICVTPQIRQQTADDNSHSASRVDPERPGFCLQGYVWREANPTDHVCVTPTTREQVLRDNAGARNGIIGQPGPAGPNVTIEWKAGSNGFVPPGAVLGGWEKYSSQPGTTTVDTEGPLYICRAPFEGAVYIGKVVKTNCNFGANGKEHLAGTYEVMTWRSAHDSLGWRRSGSAPPPGALAGGRSPAGRDVYICRISYSGGIHPGWQVPGQDACSIGYGGNEVQRPGMSYLVPQTGKPIDGQ